MKVKKQSLIVNRIHEVTISGDFILTISDEGLNSIGVTRHTWNKWLKKKKDPEMYQMEPIAEALQCSMDELVTRRDLLKQA